MLMALYNVSINVKGLNYISENLGLLPLIWTLLDGRKSIAATNCRTHTKCCHPLFCVCLTDGDWEVCLHSLRLLQSVLLEGDVLLRQDSPLLDPELQARVSQLTSSVHPSLKLTAQQALEDLQTLQQVRHSPSIDTSDPLLPQVISKAQKSE